MTSKEKELWTRIQEFEVDDPSASFTFSERLAKENHWSIEYTLRCIDEYKRFMFLLCCSDQPLTPSDQVDQVWHLHLIYTRSYWEDFCGSILGKDIHHVPTEGGITEKDKFSDLYENTLSFYRSMFGGNAPSDIWPEGLKRFADISFRRVNTRKNWIIKKPVF